MEETKPGLYIKAWMLSEIYVYLLIEIWPNSVEFLKPLNGLVSD